MTYRTFDLAHPSRGMMPVTGLKSTIWFGLRVLAM